MMSRKSVLLAIIFSLLLLFFYKKDTILILGDDFALNWVEQGEFFLQKTKLRIKASPKQSLSESINLLDDTPVVFYFLSRHQLYHFKDLPLEDILKQRLYHYDYFDQRSCTLFAKAYQSEFVRSALVGVKYGDCARCR